MPIGPYKNFAACVAAQKKKGKSDEAAKKICGFLEQKSKGELTDEEYEVIIAEEWAKEVLGQKE